MNHLDEYFRGFVELNDNKKAKTSYKKGKTLLTYDQALTKSNFAGVLDDDTILIDIDDEEQSSKLKAIVIDLKLNTTIIKTTRGRHFLFRKSHLPVIKCFTHTTLAVGLTADIKVGVKNSYEVLKFHDTLREIEYETDSIDPLPLFLIPITAAPEFLVMEEGDGRNQSLFNYILTLQKYSLSVDEIRNILTLINKYILKSPLPEKELNLLMRDEAFKKPTFYENGRFLHEKFGEYIINQYHIKRINGLRYIYVNGRYIPDTPDNKIIEHEMIKFIPSLNNQKRTEVFKYINIQKNIDEPVAPANFILFKNCIYNINTDVQLELSPEYLITNQIPWNYNPEAKNETVDEVLDALANGDKSIRLLLEEMIGFCFYRRSEAGRCFILKGEAANGKSTLLTTITNLLGKSNVSALDLCELNDRFSTIMVNNKLANIGDDISDDFIPSTGAFKKIVTGNTMSAEQKGVPKMDFTPYAKLLFSANNVPRIGKGKDATAIARRLVIVPLTAKFTEESDNFKPYIIDELRTESAMEYLILLGINGLKRWLRTQKFTISENVTLAIEEFKKDNNPMISFLEELDEEGPETSIDDVKTHDIFTRYLDYCQENKRNACTKDSFMKQLMAHFKDYKVLRKSVRSDGKIIKVPIIVRKDYVPTMDTGEK